MPKLPPIQALEAFLKYEEVCSRNMTGTIIYAVSDSQRHFRGQHWQFEREINRLQHVAQICNEAFQLLQVSKLVALSFKPRLQSGAIINAAPNVLPCFQCLPLHVAACGLHGVSISGGSPDVNFQGLHELDLPVIISKLPIL